jgi:flagellar P-ring protein precursor FlgI
MQIFKSFVILLAMAAVGTVFSQTAPAQTATGQASPGGATPAKAADAAATEKALEAALKQQYQLKQQETIKEDLLVGKQERDGVSVRLDALCHFRGTWSQQLMGVGLVTGLDRTGDSQSYTATQIAAANLLKKSNIGVDTTSSNFIAKNLALVTVTAELPPYSTPGQRIDLTVSAMGDASSLRNGTLLFTTLKYPGSEEVYAIGEGHISVGGFSAQAGGNKTSRGFVTVGKIPAGGIVQQAVATNTVFDGKIYLDLEQEDVLTAERIEEKITEVFPEFMAHALGAGTVEVTVPKGRSTSWIQSKLMQLNVYANTEAKVVVDERSGTIIIGGNVRLAPCAIARGSISVQVVQDNFVSQPGALSGGKTAVASNSTVTATEDKAQVSLLRANATVADLADIFQTLKLKAEDIIAILENLRAQGALKAKLEIQ